MPQKIHNHLNVRKLYLIYIDILGFAEKAKKDAIASSLSVEEVRRTYVERVERCLERNRSKIHTFKRVSLDSWLIFTKNVCDSLEIIYEIILKTKLPFEIGISIREFNEHAGDLTLTNGSISFLKENIIKKYREWFRNSHGHSPTETFIVLTTEVYRDLQCENICCKFDEEGYYFIPLEKIEELILRQKTKKIRLKQKNRKISVSLSEHHYEMLEALVMEGEYASISEAVRDAIRRLLAEKINIISNQLSFR